VDSNLAFAWGTPWNLGALYSNHGERASAEERGVDNAEFGNFPVKSNSYCVTPLLWRYRERSLK